MKLIERMKTFHTRQQRRRARIQAYLDKRALHPTPKSVPQD